jgi:F420-dependent oxidoreductase-like protein
MADLRIFVEPQFGATYDEILGMAKATEAAGFDAFFRSDHYLSMGESQRSVIGSTDAWTTVAGLARETSRIRLGTLLSSGTFRLPGPLAIVVAQVDAMSGGRVELGLGAGWYEAEHRAYGIAFPSTLERFHRLDEELAIVTGLWGTPVGETFSFSGEYFTLTDSPALPKPVQDPRPPIIVGGKGLRRTPAIAARYADEFNLPFVSREDARVILNAVDEACEAIDRDPNEIRRSVALTTICGANGADCERRAGNISRDLGDLRGHGLVGTPAEIAEQIARFVDLGISRVYLQMLDITDVDQVAFAGEELIPLVRSLD